VGLNRVDAAQRPAQRSVEFPVPSRAIPGTANLRRLHDLSLRSPRRPCATRSNSVIPFLLFTTERVGLCLPFSAALFPWRFCSQTSTWLIPSTTKPKNLTSTSWLRRKPLLAALPSLPKRCWARIGAAIVCLRTPPYLSAHGTQSRSTQDYDDQGVVCVLCVLCVISLCRFTMFKHCFASHWLHQPWWVLAPTTLLLLIFFRPLCGW
jgi:hypothetical protein